MDCTTKQLSYKNTGYFSPMIVDYLQNAEALKPFYAYPTSEAGLKESIKARQQFSVNRIELVEQLKKQYSSVEQSNKVAANIELLLSDNTFTITTAHQNNIFTGPLYFIYKILHAIKLAQYAKELYPQYNFVPVYYIGSEDADLEELNNITISGEKLVWKTRQTGAVGRMKIDKEITQLLHAIEGQVGVLPFGNEIIQLFRDCYTTGKDVQTATFHFVNRLLGEYGIVVLLPDNALLKRQMQAIFKDDLLHQTASSIVADTLDKLDKAGYKAQANPREINLFYLKDSLRERIVQEGDEWQVINTAIRFTKEQLLQELTDFPERFSPNVILRGLYQCTILPDIAFIGGGGEIAYWLQLKPLFDHYSIPYPVLVLRNSFLLVEKKWKEKIDKLQFEISDFFQSGESLLTKLVERDSKNRVKLNGGLAEVEKLYEDFRKQALSIDTTLDKHVESLKTKAVYRLHELEKKMLRAEKRKFTEQQQQITAIRNALFPGNSLQERKDNISYYYGIWGKELIEKLLDASLTLEQEFVILTAE